MSHEEVKQVEALANALVLQNSAVETRLMALDDAKASGAMALFGEKYGEEVRVVSMGEPQPGANKAWSVELCGGTHVRRTGDIGLVKIVGESASSAGVRRIEALTADGARSYLAEADERLREVAAILKTRPDDVVERLRAIVEERKALEKQLADAKKQIALGGSGGGSASGASPVGKVGDTNFFRLSVSGVDMKDLKAMADEGRAKVGSGVVAIANASADGKLGIVVAVTPDLTGRFNAVDLVRAAAEKSGGKGGGGRPDMAQAGGPDGAMADEALAAVEALIGG
jgi:alanyl-tRNA synthetase